MSLSRVPALTLRTVVQSVLIRFGYLVVKWPLDGTSERELQRLLTDRAIETVLLNMHAGVAKTNAVL